MMHLLLLLLAALIGAGDARRVQRWAQKSQLWPASEQWQRILSLIRSLSRMEASAKHQTSLCQVLARNQAAASFNPSGSRTWLPEACTTCKNMPLAVSGMHCYRSRTASALGIDDGDVDDDIDDEDMDDEEMSAMVHEDRGAHEVRDLTGTGNLDEMLSGTGKPEEIHEFQVKEMSTLLTFALNVQDEQNWEYVLQEPSMKFSEIAQNAYVAPSTRPGGGLGLFAARDLDQNVVATLYPVHGIGWRRTDGSPVWLTHPEADEKFRTQDAHGDSGKTIEILHESVIELTGASADVDPKRADVKGWLGHRVNDAAICSDTSEKAILQYLETCQRERNCVMVPFGEAAPIMAVFTTRAVRKDEELLYCYGYDYWIENEGLEMSEEMYTSDVMRATVEIWGDEMPNGLTEIQEECLSRLEDAYGDELEFFEDVLCRHYDAPEIWKHVLQRRRKSDQPPDVGIR